MIDDVNILFQARHILHRLRVEKQPYSVKAALAILDGRHDQRGMKFVQLVRERAGADLSTTAMAAAIEAELRGAA